MKGRVALAAGSAAAVLVWLAATANAQTPTPSPSASPDAGPLVNVNSAKGITLLILFIVAVVLVWTIPFLWDIAAAYRKQRSAVDAMIKSFREKLTSTDLKQLARIVRESPSGTKGLTRALIALTILTALSLALFLTLFSSAADAADLRKTLITGLLSILGTIVGFYFGSRSATDATEAAAKAAGPGAGAPAIVPPPRGLDATVSDTDVTLSWTAPEDTSIKSFNIYRGADHIGSVGSDATSYTDSRVPSGTYSYTVSVVDTSGNESPKTPPIQVTVP